jgi:formamidopyrimidine-DNA glycosylase
MPELPEVETIKNELEPVVTGRTITGVTLLWERTVRRPSVEEFRAGVTDRKITGLSRRGKYLFFHLDDGAALVVHLKMTGSLLINPPPDPYTRAVIHLDNGDSLHFRDMRKFGGMWLVKDAGEVAGKLGPEPLGEGFTAEVLAGILRKRTTPVKAVLLDQSLIAGIGNMYADEALFEAGVHPLRPAGGLTRAQVKRLHGAIREVLLRAIKSKGASVRNYTLPDGSAGTAHDEFRVAHRAGHRCPRCGTPIERIVVRGRGTYLCPRCQPAP